MFNAIIRFSLHHRAAVLFLAVMLVVVGSRQIAILPIDVLPDLNRPRVAIMTECPGLAPEEVEVLVTTPLETALAGASGVSYVRSSSTTGLSVISVEFDWGVDVYRSRQIVNERLGLAAERIPENYTPQMSPVSSVMGQIMILGLWCDDPNVSPMELRTAADWVLAKQLRTVEGVAEIFVMGGGRKQYQVLVRPDDLLTYGVRLHEIEEALGQSNRNVTGGYLTQQGADQLLVRAIGRAFTKEDLERLVVKSRSARPVLLKNVADVVEAPAVRQGDASAYIRDADGQWSGGPAVMLTIEKQPDEDTRRLTEELLAEVDRIEKQLAEQYPGIRIECLYQQRQFIDLAIANVIEALWLGALLVAGVLVLFLLNIRTTLITLTAIPLSIVVTGLVFAGFGLSINTMTLGGLAVAMGELVDDAIVDVENIFRRLRANAASGEPRTVMRVVFDASCEIRNSIINGSLIVVLVFLPLFFLTGIEGRLFRPLGIAYVVSILSSLVVSLTVTPVLSYYLLPKSAAATKDREGIVLRAAKACAEGAIRFSLAAPRLVLGTAAALVALAVFTFFQLDRNFMAAFNEGAVQLNVDLMPGRSLETTGAVADHLAHQIQSVEGVRSIARKTGRAELDEHVVPVNTTEFICAIDPNTDREFEDILADLEALIAAENIPGSIAFSDQPLQHLINHLRAGTRARVAVKLRGDDLGQLRARARLIQERMSTVPGVGRVRIEPIQVDIPQLIIRLDRDRLAQYGLTPYDIYEYIETAMNGRVVTEMVEGRRFFDVLLRMKGETREDIDQLRQLPIHLPEGGLVTLRDVAEIDPDAKGPYQIDHEDGLRQLIIQSNPRDRGAVDVKQDIETVLAPEMAALTSGGYGLTYAGMFESEEEASFIIGALSTVALLGVFVVLYNMFRSANLALQIMVALPLALVGGVAALVVTGQDRTVPALVGMISLCGIASRNGILLIDHYFHLVRHEGEGWTREMLVRAGRNRVAPVLMTALTSAIGLVPLTLAPDEPGREILYPIATVVVGGLITSTLMEFFVRPALFWLVGCKAADRALAKQGEHVEELNADASP